MCDKNISPVSWYVGSYLLRFVEAAQEGQFDPEQRFLAWENTVLVKADSMEKAYDKIEQIAQSSTEPYQAGETAALVHSGFMKESPSCCLFTRTLKMVVRSCGGKDGL